MQILGLVADLGERGQAGADMEIHVAEIGVLGDVEADGDRRRVAVADLEIDVAHGRIECAWNRRRRCASLGGTLPGGGNGTRMPVRGVCAAGTRAGEHHHDAHAFLKTRRVVRQQEHGRALRHSR